MTTIRGDGPRQVEPRVTKQTTGAVPTNAVKKPTVQIAAFDTVGAGPADRAAAAVRTEAGEQPAAAGASPKARALFDQLADAHLGVDLTGTPAGRFTLETPPAMFGAGFVADEKTLAVLDVAMTHASVDTKTALKETKHEVLAAGARVWLKISESAETSGAAQRLVADAKAKPDLQKVATAIAALRQASGKTSLTVVQEKEVGGALAALADRAGEANIEELVSIVMMLCAKDARQDVKSVLDEITANNAQKKKKREQIQGAKDQQAALQQEAKFREDYVAAAEKNVGAASEALAKAKAAYDALVQQRTAKVGDAQGDLDRAKTALEAAKTAKEAADAALAAASRAKTTIDAVKGNFPGAMNDPMTQPCSWSSNVSMAGTELGGEQFGGLVASYNVGKPPAERASDIADLLMKLGGAIPPLNSDLSPNYDKVIDNLAKLKQFANECLAIELTKPSPNASKIRQLTRYIEEAEIQKRTREMTKATGAPPELCHLVASVIAKDPAKASEVQGWFNTATAAPLSASKYATCLGQIGQLIRNERQAAGSTEEQAKFDALAVECGRASQCVAKATSFEMESGDRNEFRTAYGFSETQMNALQQIYDALPDSEKQGKTMMEWARSCPGLVWPNNDSDFATVNANRQAMATFLAQIAPRVTPTTAQTSAASTAGAAAAAKQAGVQSAESALADAKNALAALPSTDTSLATAKQAVEAAAAEVIKAKAEAAAARQRADDQKPQIEKLQSEMDTLGDISSETQLRMQMMMDRMQKAQTTLSNLMASFAKVKDTIIGNLK
ncbi:MAG: hypothetical protein IT381_02235 [Deltaproteobacteria bacterium]|nr:hypothetical protein [Deltaproteobacteria bacterium]